MFGLFDRLFIVLMLLVIFIYCFKVKTHCYVCSWKNKVTRNRLKKAWALLSYLAEFVLEEGKDGNA